ncbi:MAG: hypothetical protein WKG00_15005 [Polyangiaceae bacterium]
MASVRQGMTTVVCQVLPGHEQALCDLLEKSIGDQVKENDLVPFARLEHVHFMRWVILDAQDKAATVLGGKHEVELAYESNYDGSDDEHLDELLEHASAGIDAIYQHCTDYPAEGARTPAARRAYLCGHALPTAAGHVAHPGLSARRIRSDHELRTRLRAELETLIQAGALPERADEARRVLRDRIRTQHPDIDLAPVAPHPISRARVKAVLGLVAVMVGGLLGAWLLIHGWSGVPRLGQVTASLALAVIAIVAVVRLLEMHEDRTVPPAPKVYPIPDSPRMRAIRMRENRHPQNPLTHLSVVKPGLLRPIILRVVLWAISWLARLWYVEGALGNLTTIHFARWVYLPRGRLLFFSNYDGSWEAYLGDFIDVQAPQLTAVWTSTRHFPPTKLLLWEGASHEEDFKRWTLEYQVPTLCWYSAYKDLSVRNIGDNARMREGLLREGSEEDAAAWLRSL